MFIAVAVGTMSAAQDCIRFSDPKVLVSRWAKTDIPGSRASHQVPTRWLEFVANFPRLGSPDWTVTRILTHEGVGYLMQDYLFDFLEAAVFHQVATNGDSSRSEVALTSAIDGAVKTKRIINESMLNKKLMCQVNGF